MSSDTDDTEYYRSPEAFGRQSKFKDREDPPLDFDYRKNGKCTFPFRRTCGKVRRTKTASPTKKYFLRRYFQ